jgi:hypothetical protein
MPMEFYSSKSQDIDWVVVFSVTTVFSAKFKIALFSARFFDFTKLLTKQEIISTLKEVSRNLHFNVTATTFNAPRNEPELAGLIFSRISTVISSMLNEFKLNEINLTNYFVKNHLLLFPSCFPLNIKKESPFATI